MGFYYAQHHSRLSEQKGTQRTKILCPKEFTFSDKKRNNILHFTCSSAEDQNSREKKKKADEKAWGVQRENWTFKCGGQDKLP